MLHDAKQVDLHPKVKIEVVVCDEEAMPTVYAIVDAAGASHLGDETLMIMPIEDAVRIRTGERSRAAIHDYVELPAEPRWAALG